MKLPMCCGGHSLESRQLLKMYSLEISKICSIFVIEVVADHDIFGF